MDWIKDVDKHLGTVALILSLVGTLIAAPLALARYVRSLVAGDTKEIVQHVGELEMAITKLETELSTIPSNYISKSEHSEIIGFIRDELRSIRQGQENFSGSLTQRLDQLIMRVGGFNGNEGR